MTSQELGETNEVVRVIPNDHLKARAAHLVKDANALMILNDIFPSTEEKRRRVDGKGFIVPNLWNSLARDFFNSPDWSPQNSSSDPQFEHLNPSSPPSLSFTGSQLRSLFYSLRMQYSLAYRQYEESALLSGEESRFGLGDPVLGYMHSLYSDMTTLPCMRDQQVPQDTLSFPSSGRRSWSRGTIDLSHDCSEDGLSAMEKASYLRDTAMEEYYKSAAELVRLQARQREVEFLDKQLTTAQLPDHIRAGLESRLHYLLEEMCGRTDT